MARFVVVLLFGISLVGCIGGSSATCIPEGTVVMISRANGSGDCPSDVVAGVALLNQTLTPMKNLSCGVTHFVVSEMFTDQLGSGSLCQGSDMFSFQDLGSDGGEGPDVMNVTCANGTTCTETFDGTWTPE